MPRLFGFLARRGAWLALVIAGAGLVALVRAEGPVDPLRPGPSSPVLRVAPVPSDPPVRWQSLGIDDGQATGPSSVVSQELGQPELLPEPAGGQRGLVDHFGEPDLYEGSPWHDQVHPIFAHPWF